jgi:hypothetical protein
MAKQIKARRVSTARKIEVGPRELMLAGLGAVSLTRKQSVKFYGVLVAEGEQLRSRIGDSVGNVSVAMNDGYYALRERVETAVAPVVARVETAFETVKGEVESRLQPVLIRFGVATAPKAARKRPAAKRAAVKRGTSKARKSA